MVKNGKKYKKIFQFSDIHFSLPKQSFFSLFSDFFQKKIGPNLTIFLLCFEFHHFYLGMHLSDAEIPIVQWVLPYNSFFIPDDSTCQVLRLMSLGFV